MDKDKRQNLVSTEDEPATVSSPAPYEDELKDYSETGDTDLTNNSPDFHPEPSPTRDNTL